MAKKDNLKDTIDKVWPGTKKELEKAIESAKKMLDKGEVYLKAAYEKGLDATKKSSLSLQKEKLYYSLGKTVASTAATKWKGSKKIDTLLKKIKKIEKQIAKK